MPVVGQRRRQVAHVSNTRGSPSLPSPPPCPGVVDRIRTRLVPRSMASLMSFAGLQLFLRPNGGEGTSNRTSVDRAPREHPVLHLLQFGRAIHLPRRTTTYSRKAAPKFLESSRRGPVVVARRHLPARRRSAQRPRQSWHRGSPPEGSPAAFASIRTAGDIGNLFAGRGCADGIARVRDENGADAFVAVARPQGGCTE